MRVYAEYYPMLMSDIEDNSTIRGINGARPRELFLQYVVLDLDKLVPTLDTFGHGNNKRTSDIRVTSREFLRRCMIACPKPTTTPPVILIATEAYSNILVHLTRSSSIKWAGGQCLLEHRPELEHGGMFALDLQDRLFMHLHRGPANLPAHVVGVSTKVFLEQCIRLFPRTKRIAPNQAKAVDPPTALVHDPEAFKPGDIVRVVKKVATKEGNWDHTWFDAMDCWVGKVCEVSYRPFYESTGVTLEVINSGMDIGIVVVKQKYDFPSSALELVARPVPKEQK